MLTQCTYHAGNKNCKLNSWRGPNCNCNAILILGRRHACNCNWKLIFKKGPGCLCNLFSIFLLIIFPFFFRSLFLFSPVFISSLFFFFSLSFFSRHTETDLTSQMIPPAKNGHAPRERERAINLTILALSQPGSSRVLSQIKPQAPLLVVPFRRKTSLSSRACL